MSSIRSILEELCKDTQADYGYAKLESATGWRCRGARGRKPCCSHKPKPARHPRRETRVAVNTASCRDFRHGPNASPALPAKKQYPN